jgi:hypothetical protein
VTAPPGWAAIPRAILHDPSVPPDAKLVYLALSSHVGGKDTAWPKQATMASYLGLSESTVRRQLKWLRAHNLIDWTTQMIGGMYSYNVYRLTAVAASTPVKPDRSQGPVDQSDRPLRPVTQTDQGNESQENENQKHQSADAPRRDDVERLCNHLADRIQSNDGDGIRPRITEGWRTAARLLMDRDNRDEAKIHKAIDWCQDHEFWSTVVLSMPKLRKNYPQLQAQAKKPAVRDPEVARQSSVQARVAARQADPLASAR